MWHLQLYDTVQHCGILILNYYVYLNLLRTYFRLRSLIDVQYPSIWLECVRSTTLCVMAGVPDQRVWGNLSQLTPSNSVRVRIKHKATLNWLYTIINALKPVTQRVRMLEPCNFISTIQDSERFESYVFMKTF